MDLYIEDPQKLLKEVWHDQDVHIVEKQYSFGKYGFLLIDVSLKSHGQDQDKKYIQSPFYRQNIRRGNTLIEDNRRKLYWGRKGTPKILDIRLQHIQYFQKKLNLKKDDKIAGQIIFEKVNQCLQKGKRIQLIKTEKVNGENSQVSYFRDLDSWVICSKNVSLLARTINDLKMYKGNRYNFAIEIAHQWFEEIKELSQQKIQQLKSLLTDKTIIGQYCGNPKFQHLVRYNAISIKWFALVANNSEEYCYDPFQMKKILQHFGFKIAKIKNISNTISSQQFYQSLESLYLKTAEAGLEDEEYGMEGSIVYFVVQEMANGKSLARSIGAGKLKTLEYRFFRKIREKMSRYCLGKDKKKDLIRKYKQEIIQLEESNLSRTPFPHEYYVQVLEAGLQLVEQTKIGDEFIRGRFISILKVLFYSIYKKISLRKFGQLMIMDEVFMDKVTQIPFLRYNGLGCPSKIIYINLGLPGMFKTYLGNKIGDHFSELNQYYEILPFISNEDVNKSMKILFLQNNKNNLFEHYYLDGCFDPHSLTSFIKDIKNNGNNNLYYKVVLIKDEIREKFDDSNYNQYPFNLQTVIMCYVGQHRKINMKETVNEKIKNLKTVTQWLKKNANFAETMAKKDLQTYAYPFSKSTKIPNINEFSVIIKTLVTTEEENEKVLYNNYCLLILRLQKIEGIKYLEGEEIDSEVEHLIKSSYPTIPSLSFKKNHNK